MTYLRRRWREEGSQEEGRKEGRRAGDDGDVGCGFWYGRGLDGDVMAHVEEERENVE